MSSSAPARGACVVCDIAERNRIVTDPSGARAGGHDNDRLARAGASRVVWAIARRSAAAQAWAAVQKMMEGALTVMEGSTVVDLARPDLLTFVAHPFLSPQRWKPTSGPLLSRADVVVVNRPESEPRPPAAGVLEEIARHRGEKPPTVADVTRPLAEWSPDLLARLQALR